jgi:hypothetical protein
MSNGPMGLMNTWMGHDIEAWDRLRGNIAFLQVKL